MKNHNRNKKKEKDKTINDDKKSENEISNLFANFKILISKEDQKIFYESYKAIRANESKEKLEEPKKIVLEEKKAECVT